MKVTLKSRKNVQYLADTRKDESKGTNQVKDDESLSKKVKKARLHGNYSKTIERYLYNTIHFKDSS